jgi:hypothetical protein
MRIQSITLTPASARSNLLTPTSIVNPVPQLRDAPDRLLR